MIKKNLSVSVALIGAMYFTSCEKMKPDSKCFSSVTDTRRVLIGIVILL